MDNGINNLTGHQPKYTYLHPNAYGGKGSWEEGYDPHFIDVEKYYKNPLDGREMRGDVLYRDIRVGCENVKEWFPDGVA